MKHRQRELIWASASLVIMALTIQASLIAWNAGIPLLAFVGAVAVLILLWRWTEACVYLWTVLGAPEEPILPVWALARHADRLADLSRFLRASHAHGAADVERLAHDAMNLERQARGLPPLTPAYRGTEDVSRSART